MEDNVKSHKKTKQNRRDPGNEPIKPKGKGKKALNRLIAINEEIDDEWWIENKDLLELHLRALEFIWVRALEWTNENLLP